MTKIQDKIDSSFVFQTKHEMYYDIHERHKNCQNKPQIQQKLYEAYMNAIISSLSCQTEDEPNARGSETSTSVPEEHDGYAESRFGQYRYAAVADDAGPCATIGV